VKTFPLFHLHLDPGKVAKKFRDKSHGLIPTQESAFCGLSPPEEFG
jgi:hypothetical protein